MSELETLEGHNRRVLHEKEEIDLGTPITPDFPTGVACPWCGNELSYWTDDNVMIGILAFNRLDTPPERWLKNRTVDARIISTSSHHAQASESPA